jgi:hypothetical protein
VLNLDAEDLPKSSLSVVLVGVASDNAEIGNDKITIGLNAREYIDNQNNRSLAFELYHFPNDGHLLPISTKVTRGSSLYIMGNLSIIEDLLLIRITQINFIESYQSASYKSSTYAWEKKQVDSSSIQTPSTPSATDIARSLLVKSKKRGRNKEPALIHTQKIPKLASLSLPSTDENPVDEASSSLFQQSSINNDTQNETQSNIPDHVDEQVQGRKSRSGRGKK